MLVRQPVSVLDMRESVGTWEDKVANQSDTRLPSQEIHKYKSMILPSVDGILTSHSSHSPILTQSNIPLIIYTLQPSNHFLVNMKFSVVSLTFALFAAGVVAAPVEAREVVAPDAYSTRSKWTAKVEERQPSPEADPDNVVDCCYSTRSAWTAEVEDEES